MTQVVVFGVFDLLHPGHLYFLREAKKHGDHLTVVVTRDTRAFQEKGRTPVFNERDRREMVATLKLVDRAVLGDRVGEWNVLKRLRPHVVCIGYDQKAEWIKKCELEKSPKVVRVGGWKTKKYGSRNLLPLSPTLRSDSDPVRRRR